MSAEPNLEQELAELKKTIKETQEKLDTVSEEILDSISETTRQLTAKIAEIDAFQHNILEKNQQKIWLEGVGAILKLLEEIREDQEIAEDTEGATEE